MILNVDPQLSQWDVGRSVSVSDSNATHIHFANQGDSKAVIIEITDGSAKIPDYLLQTGKQLCVYAVANGVTIEKKVFPVSKRERPENYVYEEDQRNYLYELIQSAEDAVADAERVTEELKTARDNGEFDGAPGYTPQKGIDYYTPEEKAELAEEIRNSITCEQIGAASVDSLIRRPNNLYKGEIKEGGYYDKGAWKENAVFKMAILPVGAVKNGDTLTFSSEYFYYGSSYLFDFFKADGTWITNQYIASYGTITVRLDADEVADGFYVAMRIRTTQDHTKLVIVNDGILEPMPYFEYLQKKANPLMGKTFNCIGDSFTAPVASWCKQLADRVGCICNNYGVASSRVSIDSDSDVPSFLSRYDDMDTSADATIIFGGINDAGSIEAAKLSLGDIDSALNNETFYGALKLLVTNIKQLMPGKKIIGVIPPDFSPSYDNALPLVQAACREIYESFAIPYADLKKDCQEMFRDDYNNATYRRVSSDGYHPSVLGQVAISEVIQGTLEKYIKM